MHEKIFTKALTWWNKVVAGFEFLLLCQLCFCYYRTLKACVLKHRKSKISLWGYRLPALKNEQSRENDYQVTTASQHDIAARNTFWRTTLPHWNLPKTKENRAEEDQENTHPSQRDDKQKLFYRLWVTMCPDVLGLIKRGNLSNLFRKNKVTFCILITWTNISHVRSYLLFY